MKKGANIYGTHWNVRLIVSVTQAWCRREKTPILVQFTHTHNKLFAIIIFNFSCFCMLFYHLCKELCAKCFGLVRVHDWKETVRMKWKWLKTCLVFGNFCLFLTFGIEWPIQWRWFCAFHSSDSCRREQREREEGASSTHKSILYRIS